MSSILTKNDKKVLEEYLQSGKFFFRHGELDCRINFCRDCYFGGNCIIGKIDDPRHTEIRKLYPEEFI